MFCSPEASTRSVPASPAPPPPVLGLLSFGLGVVGGLGDAVGGAVTAVGGALETVSTLDIERRVQDRASNEGSHEGS